ncbi:MAG: PsbP-related protein [Methanothermobacter sp.]|jgi:hypothetical protein
MKKIGLYTFIISILALVIFTSGCTNNEVNQSDVGNYSVNGLSFSYPIEWVIQGQTRGNVNYIYLYDQEYMSSNETKGDIVIITSTPSNENTTYETVKKGITNSTNISYKTSEGTVNIAGLVGNLTIFNGTDSNGNKTQTKLIYFEKNNFTYILTFNVIGGINIQDQQKYFDTIINSLQIP